GYRFIEILFRVKALADPILGVIGHLAGRIGLDILAELAYGEGIIGPAVIPVRRGKELIRVARWKRRERGKLRKVPNQSLEISQLFRQPVDPLAVCAHALIQLSDRAESVDTRLRYPALTLADLVDVIRDLRDQRIGLSAVSIERFLHGPNLSL